MSPRGWLTCDCGEHFADDATLQIHRNLTNHKKAVRVTVTVPDAPVAGPADAPPHKNCGHGVRNGFFCYECNAYAQNDPRAADAVRPYTKAELEAFDPRSISVMDATLERNCALAGSNIVQRLLLSARASVEAQEDAPQNWFKLAMETADQATRLREWIQQLGQDGHARDLCGRWQENTGYGSERYRYNASRPCTCGLEQLLAKGSAESSGRGAKAEDGK